MSGLGSISDFKWLDFDALFERHLTCLKETLKDGLIRGCIELVFNVIRGE